MSFTSGICPHCLGDVQFEESEKNGHCLHCDSLVTQEEIYTEEQESEVSQETVGNLQDLRELELTELVENESKPFNNEIKSLDIEEEIWEQGTEGIKEGLTYMEKERSPQASQIYLNNPNELYIQKNQPVSFYDVKDHAAVRVDSVELLPSAFSQSEVGAETADDLIFRAEEAFTLGQYSLAEELTKRCIEISPNNYQAWLLQGRAAVRTTTLENIRYNDMIDCLISIPDFAPNQTSDLNEVASQEIREAVVSTTDLVCKAFETETNSERAEEILNWCNTVKASYQKLYEKNSLTIDCNDLIGQRIDEAVHRVWSGKALPLVGIPNSDQKQCEEFKEITSLCLMLTRHNIYFDGNIILVNLNRYKRLVQMNQILLSTNTSTQNYDFRKKRMVSQSVPLILGNERLEIEKENQEYHRIIASIEPNTPVKNQSKKAHPSKKAPVSPVLYIAIFVLFTAIGFAVWFLFNQ